MYIRIALRCQAQSDAAPSLSSARRKVSALWTQRGVRGRELPYLSAHVIPHRSTDHRGRADNRMCFVLLWLEGMPNHCTRGQTLGTVINTRLCPVQKKFSKLFAACATSGSHQASLAPAQPQPAEPGCNCDGLPSITLAVVLETVVPAGSGRAPFLGSR